MKKLISFIFKHLKLRKMEKQIPVKLTYYSQPHVLQQRMFEKNLSHGDRVVADINPVRIENHTFGPCMYFCPTQELRVSKIISHGDGLRLPEEAIVHSLTVPVNFKPGLYNLKNVTLFSNGTIQVIANEATVFEPYEPPMCRTPF